MTEESTKPTLVPFGKYKGQPVEVLAQDKEYCEWLAGQDWFRTRFTAIHTLIINNFAAPHETPEHNALQARFLDADWCQQFALASGWKPDFHRALNDCFGLAQHYAKQVEREVTSAERDWAEAQAAAQRLKETDWNLRYRADVQQRLATVRATFETVRDIESLRHRLLGATWGFRARCEFEVQGVDVVLHVCVATDAVFPHYYKQSYGGHVERFADARLDINESFAIECKPLVGDDYPAVLRQMKATDAHHLLAGEVRSATVPVDWVRKIFATAGITVLTVAEVAAQSLLWKQS
jgi:hypothetical protein